MRVLPLLAGLLAATVAVPAGAVVLKVRGATSLNLGDAAEIPAYDPDAKRLFVVGVDGGASFVKIVDAKTGTLIGSLDTAAAFPGGSANSVAVGGGKVAVALQAANKTDAGRVLVYDLANLAAPPQSFTVGSLPDQLSFSPDGKRILVANEGEPNSYGQPDSVDPEGSVSLINLADATVRTAGFAGFNGDKAALQAKGVRIFGPGASVAQDLEPEFTAFSPDGKTAFVTLQENNAIAIIDLDAPGGPAVKEIVALGFKSYAPGANMMDPSDRDGIAGNFLSRAGIYGIYQPDAVKAVEIGGRTYYITADEGDAREYAGFDEVIRASSIGIEAPFGRLEGTNTLGATGPDDAEFVAFGGRSFSIYDEDGNRVFDSGDIIEKTLFELHPEAFADGRSDSKGPEPEAIEVGWVDGRLVLFVGLERANGVSRGTVLAFDITDFDGTGTPKFIGAIVSSLLGRPEGLSFFTRGGRSYLAVADEQSGNLAIFALNAVSEPAVAGLFGLGITGAMALRRRRRR
jgi:hypothetical protein